LGVITCKIQTWGIAVIDPKGMIEYLLRAVELYALFLKVMK